MSKRPTYEELKKKLAEAEALIAALGDGEVNEIISERDAALLGVRELEEAYIESEQNFRNAIDTCPLGVRIVTKDGELLYANQAMLDICGFQSLEELKAIPRKQLYTPESYAAHQERKAKRERGKLLTGEYEVDIICPKGEIRNLLVFRREIIWGGESHFMSMYQDITERKKAEERHETILKTTIDGFWTVDSEGNFLEVNDAYCEMIGYTRQELLQMAIRDVEAIDSQEDIAARIQKIIKQGSDRFETRHRHKDGRIIDVEVSTKYLDIEDGQFPVFVRDITRRKRAEDDLKKSEEKYRSVAELIPDGIVTIDTSGVITSMNKEAEKITGYCGEEIVGKRISNVPIIGGKTVPKALKIFNDFIKGNGPSVVEIPCRKKDGTPRIGEFRATLMKTDGKINGIQVIARDVTERKKAEEALRASEEFSSSLMDNSPTPTLVINPDTAIRYVNPAFEKLAGFSAEETLGRKAPYPWWTEETLGKTGRDLERAMYEGASGIEELFQKKDGERFQVEITSTPVIKDGEFRFYLANWIDITERKRAEERISNLNRTLRSIRDIDQLITRENDRKRLIKGICNTLVNSRSFNNAWIALLDGSGRLLTSATSGFSGRTSARLKKMGNGNLPPCVEKALLKRQVVITRDPHSTCGECPLKPDFDELCSATIRIEHEGNIYGILCASMPHSMLSDPDELQLFDEVAADIAFALHEITLEDEHQGLENERLRSAKLESISTLAGGIAHDFNNLLTGIMGNIGLARKYSSSSKKVSQTLDEAEKAAVRARALTQQLLTFAMGGKPVKKTVDIAELIQESATFALRGSATRLELSLPDDLWKLDIDEGQINQVIHNLVINADEAMPAAGTLEIKCMNIVLEKSSGIPLRKGRYVRIDIRDSGIGISRTHLQRIFEPYFTTKKKGSGLGLSTAYSIIKNHGGYVTAISDKNKGTTFSIYLPASRKSTGTKEEVKPDRPVRAGGRVLVMDDEESIRKMLGNMLKLAGYKAVFTSEGSEALAKYTQAMEAKKPFDVVIMDLTIPGGMGGKETIKELLKIDSGARVIVSSGYATDPIMSEFKKYGFSAVITKPYSVKKLEDTLRGISRRRKTIPARQKPGVFT